ncbi:coiled-coil domain-containing protein 91-like [Mya arenaria]|uniref:coiled-coil domain-containing protein 91-like n=1 Tax=Mya arenaria TaxID=6604 RepID=UPI0022E2C910|nr:coiled-coil domain-containing protein 91-like [Mya arenaria]
MSQNQNADDDDFGDFGGFEGAEPTENENQGGAQAAPNVWAAMFAPAVPGMRNVQPDLLCGQNRFPAHLDTPTTVDIASSAQARVPSDLNSADGATGEDGDGLNEQDNFSLANDILDGSFRSSSMSNQSQMPDISGLDIGHGAQARADSAQPSAVLSRPAPGTPGSDQGGQGLAERAETGGATGGPANEIAENKDESANQVDWSLAVRRDAAHADENNAIVQRALQEKESIKQELTQQQGENARLAEDLVRAEALATEARQNLEKVNADHTEQLEALRSAGHEAVTMVVGEYRASLATLVQEQRETGLRSVTQTLSQETDHLRHLLVEQKEEFDRLQEVERKKNEKLLKEAIAEMKEKNKEQVVNALEGERTKYEAKIQDAIQAEQEGLERRLTEAVKEEQDRGAQALKQQQEQFTTQMSEEAGKHREQLEKALHEQQDKYKEELSVALREERSRGQDALQGAVRVAREDMTSHLQHLRESDQRLHRRQLASLDLFLESARQQLALLMTTPDKSDHSGQDNPTDSDSGVS